MHLYPAKRLGLNWLWLLWTIRLAVINGNAATYPVAYWRMEAQILAPNFNGAPTFTGVADSDIGSGQGLYTTGSLSAAVDDLITFNGLTGGPVALSTNVPPLTMFVNGNSAGSYSYNAEAITNVDGCLFFPQDQYGDEMDFTSSFSLELFFKTDGNHSNSGVMELISQGTDTGQTFRYGVNVNESAPGGVRFKIANATLGQTNQVDLIGANYADGSWHYLLAVMDAGAGTNGQMRLTIVNQNGTQVTATNNLPPGFMPLPATDNGNMFIGRYTYPLNVNPETFLGFIDEVQVSAGIVSDSIRIGRIPSVDNIQPTIIIQPASQTVLLGGPATFTTSATSAFPINYQWRLNGNPIAGATNTTLKIFPINGGQAGSYDVIVANLYGATNSLPAIVTVMPSYQVAYWQMEAQIIAPNNNGVPSFNGVADADTASGQGIYTTGSLPAAIDDLITFNGLTNNPVTLSTNVAPNSMFVNGHSAGTYSYNAAVITNVDGVLFFPQDQYGDEMDFTGPFTVELFFKTDGNRSGAGQMELVSQGTDVGQTFRYGIAVNESAPGGIRFKIANSSLNQTNWVELSPTNYANGQWHYLLAVCDTLSGSNGQIRLTIANQDGSLASATNNLPLGFLPLPAADNGNLFLGRLTYPDVANGGNPCTFLGLMDEVQITAGVEPDALRIGNTILVANPPNAAPTNNVYAGTTVTLNESPTGLPPFYYQWQSNSVNIAAASNSTLVLANVGTNVSASYRVIVSNNTAIATSPAVALTVNPASKPIFISQPSPVSTTNYVNGLTLFTAVVNGTQPISFQWQHNGTNLAVRTSSIIVLSGLQPSDAGTYTLIASNAFGIVSSLAASLTVLPIPSGVSVNVLTYHNDNARDGANTNEFILTPATVNVNTFGRLFNYAVDGYVYAQPLYVSGVAIPGQGVHNVVIVATEHGSIYAFDADGNYGTNGGLLWRINLGIAPQSNNHEFGQRYGGGNYYDIVPEVGLTGTPVIDPVTGTLYVNVLTRTVTTATNYIHQIHALNITNGLEQSFSPVIVSGTVPGAGVDSSNGVVRFNARQENSRPGMTLAGGMLYAAYGSFADTDPYHGWVIGFNPTNLQQATNFVFNTTPNATVSAFGANAAEGALWMAGNGLCVDANTNIYFETGNGSFSANTNGGDYSDSFVKLSSTNGLRVADYFTPYNQAALSGADEDLGSGGPVLLPDSVGSTNHPHLMVGCGKEGKIYLLDRDNLGHYNAVSDGQIVQEIPNAVGGTWSVPAYFNHQIYYQGLGDVMKGFAINNGVIGTTPVSAATTSFGAAGGSPSISANGTNNGIVWTIQPDAFASGGPAVLHAYNATNLALEIYNSNLNPPRDNPGGAVKMTTPTVANGKVYVAGQYFISVFGNGYFLTAPTIFPAGGTFTNAITLTMSDASPSSVIYYTLDGTIPTASSLLYSGPFVLTSNAVVSAVAIAPGAVNSAVASASFVNTAAVGNGVGLLGLYFANHASTSPFTGAPTLVQTNATINFNWGASGPSPVVGSNNFTVRWIGCVQPQYNETYNFISTADDGVRLYVNGQLLINDWVDKTNATSHTNSLSLVAQQFYNLELDYYEKTSNSLVSLAWSSPSTPLQIIPQTQLYPVTNPPPTVVLVSPANLASYTAAASVTLSAEADAPYNPIGGVNFYANSTYLGGVSNAPYTLTATGLAAGSYTLTAVAVDGSGLGSTSAPVNIMVNPASGLPYGLTNNGTVPPFFNLPTTFSGLLPAQLSLTGIFSNTASLTVTNGLIAYQPNTPLWSDGAVKTRYFAVPNHGGVITPDEQITFAPTGAWTFPAGTVFVKTFQLNTDTANPNVLHRLETRLLVRDLNGQVYGVTYKWRPDNSDADLLLTSSNEVITITNATGNTAQTWYYPSPADCLSCHTPVANYVLGMNARQLNGNLTYATSGVTDNQLRTLNRLGLFNPAFDEGTITNFEKLSALTNWSASLQERSRSYLDANCAQCHQPGGSGITFDARYDMPLASQNITNYPAAFNLGYDGACIVKNQDVWRSMLWQRINTTNSAIKMPPLARYLIDTNAAAVIGAWINSLPGTPALAPPSIQPNGGNYYSTVNVTLTAPATNAAIYYTLDGTLPTTNSPVYATPFPLTSNATVTANVWAVGYNASVAANALFLVQPLHFSSVGFLPNQQLQLGFIGMTGSNYVLQASTNLTIWTPLLTNTAATNAFNFLDPNATNFSRRFYRVKQQ